ncbi:MAG: histidine phosphatase family protein [Brevefilum sp.]
MATFLLIRHGLNDMVGEKLAGRTAGVHLNEDGKAQARRLAAETGHLKIAAIYSSPLERALETAEPIARVHDLNVEIVPELIEIDFGKWQGKHLKKLKKGRLWKAVQSSPGSFRFPDGESFEEAQNRVAEGLKALSEKHEKEDLIVCVAHSDVIRLAVAHFLGLSLNDFQRLRISTASVTVMSLYEGEAFFNTINQTFGFPKLT